MAKPVSELYQRLVRIGHERRGECFLIQRKSDKFGYVRLHQKVGDVRSSAAAHRVSYEQWHGPIPVGYHVDHICHNEAAHAGQCSGGNTCWHRRCVNPAHLRAVTQQENLAASPRTARGHEPRGASARNARATHCPQGHEYDSKNTRIKTHKGRVARDCMACDRARHAAVNARNLVLFGPKIRKVKAVCINGHQMTEDNILHRPGKPNARTCKACTQEQSRQEAARRKAKRAEDRAARMSTKVVKICTVNGCEQKSLCRDMCKIHYRRFMQYGDPGPVGRLKAPRKAKEA